MYLTDCALTKNIKPYYNVFIITRLRSDRKSSPRKGYFSSIDCSRLATAIALDA